MTIEDTNTKTLKEAFRQWHDSKGASIDHWLDIMAQEVKFRSLAEGCKGLEFTCLRNNTGEIAEYFEGLKSQFEMIHYTVDHYVAQGDRVVAIGSTAWRNRATGKEFDTPKIDTFRFNQEGKIIEFFELYDTAMILATC